MTIQESIEQSAEPLTIFIVKEALFCTVYEQSAWLFVHLVRPYKPVKKFVKKLAAEVVSMGFPKSQLQAIHSLALDRGWLITDEPGRMIILVKEEPVVPFQDWKQSVSLSLDQKSMVSEQPTEYPVREAISKIADEIQSYNVADHTPMQSMQFLIDMQNKIKLVRKMPE
jgi:hypothetical protein